MTRVLVIGCSGAGKSFFSRSLAERTGLPLFPLDFYFHQSGWPSDASEKRVKWREKVSEFVAGDRWIIDGNYTNSLDIRLPRADTVIYLDFPTSLCLRRVIKRQFEYRDRRRPDMPPTWKEKLSPDFVWFVLTYNRKVRPRIMRRLEECAEGQAIHILKSPAAASSFLAEIAHQRLPIDAE